MVGRQYLLCLGLGLCLTSAGALADQYHYQNVIIGDRAMGMGGAFGAVADDASGVYYNPAGLAFALSNDISGSANAMVTRKITYKDTIGGQDFEERSSGTIPAFFGGLQKLDSISKKLVFAFGVYTTDGEQKDQDDLVKDTDHGTEAADGSKSFARINRFHRTVNFRGSTSYAGGAVGYRLSNNFSVGFGLNYVSIEELTQEYQDVSTTGDLTIRNEDGSTTTFENTNTVLTQNIRQLLSSIGLQATLGLQFTIQDRFSIGLTLKGGQYLTDSFEGSREIRQVQFIPVDGGTVTSYATPIVDDGAKVDGPLGSMQNEARLAFAWFASTKALVTFDMIHYGKVDDAADITFTGQGGVPYYNREAVTNFATGLEYYLKPAVPMRLGLFSNNSNTPEVEKGKSDQLDHIDYLGQTVFLAYVQPNSQIAAGVILQQGSGKAQKAGGYAIQDIEANMFTFAFSATHSF